MNSQEKPGQSGRTSVRLLVAGVFAVLAPVLLFATSGPSWWYNPAVTTSGTAPVISGTAADYGMANQGGAKNIAVAAVNELNNDLASLGGAGSTLNGLAASLSATSGSTSDYSTLNLGELKALAKPFYDRLFSIDYYGPPAVSGTIMTSGTYPWIAWGGTASDYSSANIGETKNIFSFDLTYSSDGNALPNWWRMYYFGTLSVTATDTVQIYGNTYTYLQAFQDHFNPLPGPVFSPSGGLLSSSTTVAITDSGATSIYYTTNGSDPATSGSLYTASIPVSGFETLRAIAYDGTAATQESAAVYSQAGSPAALSAGGYHTLEIKGDGTVWAWGANYNAGYYSNEGQLGIGTYVDQWYPAEVVFSSSAAAVSVAAGGYHSLAVTSDGQVWAWGLNDYAQLGKSTSSLSSTNAPIAVIGGTNAIAVAAGATHSVALTSGSAILTWGSDGDGELGTGTYGTPNPTPSLVTLSNSSGTVGARAVAAGTNFTAALASNGTVWEWGLNGYDECGQFTGGIIDSPTQVSSTNVANIVAIATGDFHTLALRSDGTVWAWGYNNLGQLGNGTYSTPGSVVEVLTGTGTPLTGVTSIAAGDGYSIAVKADGTVWSWGQLGEYSLTGASSNNFATQISGVSGAVFATAGYHVLIAGSNGSVTAMGYNSNGQLGVGTAISSTTPALSTAVLVPQPSQPSFSPDGGIYSAPQQVTISCTDSAATIFYTTDGSVPAPGNGTVIASGQSVNVGAATVLRAAAVMGNVSSLIKSAAYHMGYQMQAGGQQSLLLDTDGSVWSWGSDASGQLGLGWEGNQTLPEPVAGLSGTATAISAGWWTTAAVMNSGTNLGTVWDWGYNEDGQCGLSSSTNVTTPFKVPGIFGATAVACGWNHTVALTGSGTLLVWGNNFYGQYGNGTTTTGTSPVAVPGLSGVKAIAAGYAHTLALLSSGTVYAWGYNGEGQLGTNTTGTNGTTPAPVPGLNNVIAIAAGEESSYALRNDGTVWAWGADSTDLLADDSGYSEPTPVLVGTLRDVVAISAGAYHCVALRGDGTVLAWGYNQNYAIASGAPTTSLPTPIPSVALMDGTNSLPTAITMVSAGEYHSLTVANTQGVQTLWGWGDDTYGELGNGTINSTYTPTMVEWSGYANSGNDGMPDWQALTEGLDPFEPYPNETGIPINILYGDGLGLDPTLPYTPYTLPGGSGGSPPTIYVTIPQGATLE